MYMRAEETDPRSLFYKRTLIRPRIPFLRMALLLLLLLMAGAGAAFGAYYLQRGSFWIAACAVVSVGLIRLLLVKSLLITMVKVYQALASDDTRKRCRYAPSCSVHMIQAVEKYGFWRGFRRGMRRWRNCKPPNGGTELP